MKSWFHGSDHPSDCVDFQTKTTLYEVKSCNLFNGCTCKSNIGNYDTQQLGRFKIRYYNHESLLDVSNEEHKKIRYVFVVIVGRQKFWKVMSWHDVDNMLQKHEGIVNLRIANIFYGF